MSLFSCFLPPIERNSIKKQTEFHQKAAFTQQSKKTKHKDFISENIKIMNKKLEDESKAILIDAHTKTSFRRIESRQSKRDASTSRPSTSRTRPDTDHFLGFYKIGESLLTALSRKGRHESSCLTPLDIEYCLIDDHRETEVVVPCRQQGTHDMAHVIRAKSIQEKRATAKQRKSEQADPSWRVDSFTEKYRNSAFAQVLQEKEMMRQNGQHSNDSRNSNYSM
ncbi:hypothetical protein CAPTEDRAFT_205289 [Capitella teleta]|uniref:Uncharacterized protein n=1 Tax=Capitella teleta TaxID=283909 RepID=R7V4D3_CAPTE|nr:hypothetical protein CAPTEDRAFT_205289 [Capitella teleta]|eukprot:ELU13327.1 hypothetical protein CAPTEDRAFT_205289 [Capitella teleta]